MVVGPTGSKLHNTLRALTAALNSVLHGMHEAPAPTMRLHACLAPAVPGRGCHMYVMFC